MKLGNMRWVKVRGILYRAMKMRHLEYFTSKEIIKALAKANAKWHSEQPRDLQILFALYKVTYG